MDYYQSSLISTVLSWLFVIPMIVYMILAPIQFIPKLFSNEVRLVERIVYLWIGLCFLVLSPIRYMLMQALIATTYSVQSFGAFLSLFLLAFYIPIVFGILSFLGIGVPILAISMLLNKPNASVVRLLAVSAIVPVALLLGTSLFHFALPYAGRTLHWLNGRDLIRATNGPAYIVYKYVVFAGTPIELPLWFDSTPQTEKDALQCHVSTIYLKDSDQLDFIERNYPSIFADLRAKGIVVPAEAVGQ